VTGPPPPTPPPAGPRPPPGPRRVNPASRERTRLAWRRTGLAQTLCALLLVKLATSGLADWVAAVAVGLATLAWTAALAVGQRRIRAMATHPPPDPGRSLPFTAAFALGCAVVGTALVVLR
jgi:uncharacterized membrane protein YidH (DUF202 family)